MRCQYYAARRLASRPASQSIDRSYQELSIGGTWDVVGFKLTHEGRVEGLIYPWWGVEVLAVEG